MADPRVALLAAFLVVSTPAAALLAGAPLAAAQSGGGVQPVLVAAVAGFGPEAWKDDPAVAGALLRDQDLPVPLPGVPAVTDPAVYENPYFDPSRPHQGSATWLGYNLTATIEVQGPGGQAVAPGTHYVEARLETDGGSIPARLEKLGGARFQALLDLDGEEPAGIPPAPPGTARLLVEVYRVADSLDPTVEPARVAIGTFPLEVGGAALDRGGFRFPEAELPGYADVGHGNLTTVQGELVRPGESFTFGAELGVPRAGAVIMAWNGAEGRVLEANLTDAYGRIATTADADRLAGPEGGLVVLAAYLTGAAGAGSAGADGTLAVGPFASASMVVPVSSHPTKVQRITLERRALPGAGVPLDPASTLLVGVDDPTAGSKAPVAGTLLAVDGNGEVLAEASLDAAGFAPGSRERTARLLAGDLQREGLTVYRLVAFLRTEDDGFYSMAQAVRGYAASATAPPVEPNQEGVLDLVLRNFNNNLDDATDPGLALTVQVRVRGLPGEQPFDTEATIEEGGETRVPVPFRGAAGTYTVVVNTTADELRSDLTVPLAIEARERGLLGLPGFGAHAAAGALLAAAAALALARGAHGPRRRTP